MLILTRRPDETVMIGDDITITILSFNRAQVRVGIDAPKSIEIHRMEVYDRIQKKRITETEKQPENTDSTSESLFR